MMTKCCVHPAVAIRAVNGVAFTRDPCKNGRQSSWNRHKTCCSVCHDYGMIDGSLRKHVALSAASRFTDKYRRSLVLIMAVPHIPAESFSLLPTDMEAWGGRAAYTFSWGDDGPVWRHQWGYEECAKPALKAMTDAVLQLQSNTNK